MSATQKTLDEEAKRNSIKFSFSTAAHSATLPHIPYGVAA